MSMISVCYDGSTSNPYYYLLTGPFAAASPSSVGSVYFRDNIEIGIHSMSRSSIGQSAKTASNYQEGFFPVLKMNNQVDSFIEDGDESIVKQFTGLDTNVRLVLVYNDAREVTGIGVRGISYGTEEEYMRWLIEPTSGSNFSLEISLYTLKNANKFLMGFKNSNDQDYILLHDISSDGARNLILIPSEYLEDYDISINSSTSLCYFGYDATDYVDEQIVTFIKEQQAQQFSGGILDYVNSKYTTR